MAERHSSTSDPDDDPLRPLHAPDDEDTQRVEAMLSLSSRAPVSLDARVASRREAGDHVLLPVPETEPTSTREHRSPARRFILPAGIAAAAVLSYFLFPQTEKSSAGDQRLAQSDSSVPASASDSVHEPASHRDSSSSRADRLPSTTPERGDVALGYRGAGTAIFTARMRDFRETTVDSVADATLRDTTYNIIISHPTGNAELAALAKRIGQALTGRGVKLSAVHIDEGGAAASIGAVTIEVRSADRIP